MFKELESDTSSTFGLDIPVFLSTQSFFFFQYVQLELRISKPSSSLCPGFVNSSTSSLSKYSKLTFRIRSQLGIHQEYHFLVYDEIKVMLAAFVQASKHFNKRFRP